LKNIKRLQREGVTYTNAFTSAPSDSFPGELNYITGAKIGTTGVFYDKSYSRALYAPGTTAAQITAGTAKPGTVVEFAENVDASWANGKGGTLDGGQGFDKTQLPVDRNGNPVYPNQYLKVNTIFDIASAAGLRTAWSDKHPAAYTILAGNTQDPRKFNLATGRVGSISDYSSLEINAAVAIDPTKPGLLPGTLGALVDQSTGTPYSNTNSKITSTFFNDGTKGNPALFKAPPAGFKASQFTSVATTSAYDDLKVKQILNEIDGLNDSESIINAGLGDPRTNERTPDIIVPLKTGYFFGNATKKRAEHGGFTDADTHVALIVGSSGFSHNLQGKTISRTVSTTQIAPTTLQVLGLNPQRLQGVQIDKTQTLPLNGR